MCPFLFFSFYWISDTFLDYNLLGKPHIRLEEKQIQKQISGTPLHSREKKSISAPEHWHKLP